MEWIVTWCVGAPSLERLKADNTEGGHVGRLNERRARIGHAPWTEMMGASPGHHDASPPHVCLSDVICHTGAAGKVVAGVRSWPDSEGLAGRGRFGQGQTDACQTRSAGRLSTLNRWDERDKLCLIRGVPRGRTVFVGYDGTWVDDRTGDGQGNPTASEGGGCFEPTLCFF
jgi:hypothetical protein